MTARCAVFLSCLVILAVLFGLATLQPHGCTAPERSGTSAPNPLASAPGPTLAPPKSMVLVWVEADKSEIEVGWAEN